MLLGGDDPQGVGAERESAAGGGIMLDCPAINWSKKRGERRKREPAFFFFFFPRMNVSDYPALCLPLIVQGGGQKSDHWSTYKA